MNVLSMATPINDVFTILYANVRVLSQAAAQLRYRATTLRPAFIVLTDTNLNGDAVEAEMLPSGYVVSARKDRTQHGGGVIIMSQEHLLVNALKLNDFYQAEVAEIIGVEWNGYQIFDGYTRSSKAAPKMFDSFTRIKEDEA